MRYSDRVARRFDFGRFRITRGALTVAALEVVVSLAWLVLGRAQQLRLYPWVAATPTTVFHAGRVWTLATSVFVEPDFLTLLLGLILLWSFIPTLERFWGTAQFFRFFAITSLTGTIAGTLAGLALGSDEPIFGISPFVYAASVLRSTAFLSFEPWLISNDCSTVPPNDQPTERTGPTPRASIRPAASSAIWSIV